MEVVGRFEIYSNISKLRGDKQARQRWYYRPVGWTHRSSDKAIRGPFNTRDECVVAIHTEDAA